MNFKVVKYCEKRTSSQALARYQSNLAWSEITRLAIYEEPNRSVATGLEIIEIARPAQAEPNWVDIPGGWAEMRLNKYSFSVAIHIQTLANAPDCITVGTPGLNKIRIKLINDQTGELKIIRGFECNLGLD